MDLLPSVTRFRANSDRTNLNCNRDPENSKSSRDETTGLGITWIWPLDMTMKMYNHLYNKVCSLENLFQAFCKAKKGKSRKQYVKEFEENLGKELPKLNHELLTCSYQPRPLKRFIIRDPKTRKIHASHFRDRVVYHALVNVLEPIYEGIFIYDSYASRKNKGTHKAIERFDYFKRKVTKNGMLMKNPFNHNSVIGYVLKADIKHYFETVDHEILLNILKRKIKDKKILELVEKILNNFDTDIEGKGMPLGNLTSQFFANVYLNDFDYFVKHQLKAKCYLRYVDDFMIIYNDKSILEEYRERIEEYLRNHLKLDLHPDKSKIIPLQAGVTALGYRNFYHYKRLRRSNLRKFEQNLLKKVPLQKEHSITKEEMLQDVQGWFGYALWANTYKLRKQIIHQINHLPEV